MCYHKQDKALMGALEAHYNAILRDIGYAPTYYENGYDFLPSPVLTANRPKEFQGMRWGLIPWWTKSIQDATQIRMRTLNCISEEMYEKSSFKDAASNGKRCLIPCTGFFEWMWSDSKGKTKYPHFVYAAKQEIFSIAGLYARWTDKSTGEVISSYTVLTTRANKLLEKIHNSKKRMPVIIPADMEKDWLNPNLTRDDVEALCEPVSDGFLTAHTISKMLTDRKVENKNVPEITKPFEYPELALLG